MFGKEVLDEATRNLVSELELPAYFLKVLSEQDASSFTEGTLCKAVYSKDGEFYPCTIERIDQEGYHIRYKKYNSKEIVKLNMLRLIKQQVNEKEELDFKDMT
jgi:survival-of-motor-neuron-related-splicing factor 30